MILIPSLLLLIGSSRALTFESLNLYVPSPIFNLNLGRQEFDYILGPVVYSKDRNVCERPAHQLEAFARRKLIMIDDGNIWDPHLTTKQIECLNRVGAKGIIKLDRQAERPGRTHRASAPGTSDPDNSIPVVHVSAQEIPRAVMEQIQSGVELIVNVSHGDINEWEEFIWDTEAFFIVWRVFLPALNYIGLLLALTACATLGMHQRHTRALRAKLPLAKRQMRTFNMRLLMFGNSLICATCATRQYYCLDGPLYSSTTQPLRFHQVFLELTVVWEVLASSVAILVLRSWAGFGLPLNERKLDTVLRWFLVGICVPLYLGVDISDGIYATPIASGALKFALLVLMSVIVSVVSLHRISTFLRHSFAFGASGTNRQHCLRIGAFLLLATVAGIATDAARIALMVPGLNKSVQCTFVLHSIVFVGLSVQGIAQVIAFFPSLSVVKNGGKIVHKGCEVAQQIRKRRQFAKSVKARRSTHLSRNSDGQVNHFVLDMRNASIGLTLSEDSLMDPLTDFPAAPAHLTPDRQLSTQWS